MLDFELSSGRVRGVAVDTPDGAAIAVLGLPTATVPGRFLPAVPADGWRGIRPSAQGPLAWQSTGLTGALPGELRMSERHCLTANVWLPARSTEAPLPVLVWVHGGAHLSGSNGSPLCNGARLAAAHGLIVVAISYRLGALGHLRLDHLLGDAYADSGNLGLRDALAGITWVHDEIAAFGGDPSRITVMGQSAGGVVVTTLLAESGDDAPFARVVIQSATAERTHTLDEAAAVTAELLHEVDGASADPTVLLRAAPAEIVAAQDRLVQRWQRSIRGPATPFRPIVDGRFVHDVPLRRIAAGAGAGIDAIIGGNRTEASAYVDLLRLGDADALAALEGELAASGRPGETDAYIAACAADDGVAPTPAAALESFVTDRLYRGPTGRMLDARRAAGARDFGYVFAWHRPDTDTWARRAGHSLELPFVFRHLDDSDAARDEVGDGAPAALADVMSASWAAFVAAGDPGSPDGVAWPGYGADRAVIEFDERTRAVRDPFRARREWTEAAAGSPASPS